jgi:hypothetical protein
MYGMRCDFCNLNGELFFSHIHTLWQPLKSTRVCVVWKYLVIQSCVYRPLIWIHRAGININISWTEAAENEKERKTEIMEWDENNINYGKHLSGHLENERKEFLWQPKSLWMLHHKRKLVFSFFLLNFLVIYKKNRRISKIVWGMWMKWKIYCKKGHKLNNQWTFFDFKNSFTKEFLKNRLIILISNKFP